MQTSNIFESLAVPYNEKISIENKLWTDGKTWPEGKVWTTQHCLPPAAVKHGLDQQVYQLDDSLTSEDSQKVNF